MVLVLFPLELLSGRTTIMRSLFLASKSHSILSEALSLKCFIMLIGTVVLRDSFPDVATERVVISPILFTFIEVVCL